MTTRPWLSAYSASMRYLFLILVAGPAWAHPPTVEAVNVTGDPARFDVTLLHDDTGWDHYADGWEILDADGNSSGFRKLHHPHVNEQPFTRSLSGVDLPEGPLFARAHCSVDGWSKPVPLSSFSN